MAENSAIEWTTHTFNPWIGCTKVGPGCDHCYAEGWAKRSGLVRWGVGAERRLTTAANWRQPVKWNKSAAAAGERPRVFCASLADVFDNEVPVSWRKDLFKLIGQTPHLDWLLLTKRIGNVAQMITTQWLDWPTNIWLGATVVNQDELDRDLQKLLAIPATIRFLSVEPMLGPIRFVRHGPLSELNWVICGGESGHGARPMEIDWAADLRAQCEARGISFFMKQGSQANWPQFKDFEQFPPSVRVRDFPSRSSAA